MVIEVRWQVGNDCWCDIYKGIDRSTANYFLEQLRVIH